MPNETFAEFRHVPALEAMLTFAGWQSGFTEHDRDALVDGLQTLRTAMVQPVGTAAASKCHGAVSDAEFSGAVLRVLAASMVLWLSGKLAEVACDG